MLKLDLMLMFVNVDLVIFELNVCSSFKMFTLVLYYWL